MPIRFGKRSLREQEVFAARMEQSLRTSLAFILLLLLVLVLAGTIVFAV